MSDVMKEVYRLLSIKHQPTVPWHPMSNGVCESYNGSLKRMLKRLCSERVKDWDRYIDGWFFVYREAPHSSTRRSPFELVQGRDIRGPMNILPELCTKESVDSEINTTYQYVLDLRERIQDTCELARQEVSKVQLRNQGYYNRKTKDRTFQVGEKILLLLPTEHNKIELQWKGPYSVVKKVGNLDYQIKMDNKLKTLHVNMLKRYVVRTENLPETSVQTQRVAAVASVLEDETDESDLSLKDSELITHYSVSAKETYQDVNINSELPDYRKKAIKNLLYKYKEIFSDVPKITNLGEHRIHVISNQIVRCKPYPLPYSQQQVLDKEIDDILAMNIIEPSEALYASPLVIVKKSDGTNRVCVDYKRLNSITAIDPEPMTMADDIFAKLGGTKVYSKFDLSKGYYQLPMSADSMDYTTFTSHRGLYRFKVMPFGLTSAPMSFNRVMRKLLYKSRGLDNYLDDVLAHSTGWTEHLQDLEDFFLRIQQANLSLRPTKCQIGYQTIDFLGHRITEDSIEPNPKKLEKILESSRPETKTQIKSFLGLIGYYQQFLPNYSKVTTPLTDLLKKNLPNKITWGMDQETAFQVLKSFILNSPVLKLQT